MNPVPATLAATAAAHAAVPSGHHATGTSRGLTTSRSLATVTASGRHDLGSAANHHSRRSQVAAAALDYLALCAGSPALFTF
jgi:hypothetical protein